MPKGMCWMSYYNDSETRKQHIDYERKLLKKQDFVPRVIVTDKLKSYEAAKKQVMKTVEHRQHKGLNNLCENSHRVRPRFDRIRQQQESHTG